MLREMYIYNQINQIEVSRKEVEDFYSTYQDSLPVVPAKYNFSIIQLPVLPSEYEVDKIKKLQFALIDSIQSGTSFENIARKFSDDLATAPSGGNQGYYTKGTLFKEFEDVAFNLEIGQISQPVQSSIGFHIIKLLVS